jgi:hypothetical protein
MQSCLPCFVWYLSIFKSKVFHCLANKYHCSRKKKGIPFSPILQKTLVLDILVSTLFPKKRGQTSFANTRKKEVLDTLVSKPQYLLWLMSEHLKVF